MNNERPLFRIDIDRDAVTLEGVSIQRPPGIAPSQWQDWWLAARSTTKDAARLAAEVERLEQVNLRQRSNFSPDRSFRA
jgi:transcription elongation factor GreA-like protein